MIVRSFFATGGGLHSPAGVQPGDLVVERGGEHRGQDGVALADHGRRRPCRLQLRHPFADVGGLDLVDPHRPEHRQDVLVEVVGVGLPGAGFHLVVGQPLVFDVAAEPLPGPARIGGPSVGLAVLGPLPRPDRLGLGLGDKSAPGPPVTFDVVIQ
jgi:hypothetical protein